MKLLPQKSRPSPTKSCKRRWYNLANIPRLWQIYMNEKQEENYDAAVEESVKGFLSQFASNSPAHKSYSKFYDEPVMIIIDALNNLASSVKKDGYREDQDDMIDRVSYLIDMYLPQIEDEYVEYLEEAASYLGDMQTTENEEEYYLALWYAHNTLKMISDRYDQFVIDLPDPIQWQQATNIPRVGNTGMGPEVNDEIIEEEFAHLFDEETGLLLDSAMNEEDVYMKSLGITEKQFQDAMARAFRASDDARGATVWNVGTLSEDEIEALENAGIIYAEPDGSKFQITPQGRLQRKLILGNF